ncbi:hypothetical protein SS50377_25509 [Spironucleus salmonicida]|uniref:Uncharacterized protein n=1 Tax=Spironucleus salmonicida TaxID=348837 RepID=V6LMW7_9EUKA|nr:hypothetical protein SS50377_25509 [Spironucleus salmonicida]|eukprot:EST45056.1 Hypothetical protein SS50377_15076 [Spironucleus salmonicida]
MRGKQIDLPSALLHEDNPRVLHSYILSKLQDLENIAYEISGIDNILTDQTIRIRGIRPSSSDSYQPKLNQLKLLLVQLKTQERNQLNFQRICSNEIESLGAKDKQIQKAAQDILRDFNAQISKKQFCPGTKWGKQGKNGVNYKKFDLGDFYAYSQQDNSIIYDLVHEEQKLDSEKVTLERKWNRQDLKQGNIVKTLREMGSMFQQDYATLSADLIKQNNWVNYLESKYKEMEFKKLLQTRKQL